MKYFLIDKSYDVVDKILDNEDHDVDKIKIITQIDEWISWLEETKIKIMKMKDTHIKE